jgi:hypothetical protein
MIRINEFSSRLIDNAHCEVIRTFYEEKVRDVNGVADFVKDSSTGARPLISWLIGMYLLGSYFSGIRLLLQVFPKFACM